MLEALLDEVARGVVHYQYWASQDTSGNGRQTETYGHCLAQHGHHHQVFLPTMSHGVFAVTVHLYEGKPSARDVLVFVADLYWLLTEVTRLLCLLQWMAFFDADEVSCLLHARYYMV